MIKKYDIIIVGAGLMGCFAARHLAARGYAVLILERENDVSMGISRANTAIVYAGYDMKPGTLKARLTVQGNAAFDKLCKNLGVAFVRPGSLMVATGPRGRQVLHEKLKQGHESGVPGLRMLNAAQAREYEPGLSPAVTAALYAPTTATVNPWQLCLAAARDAVQHGATLCLEHEVTAIERPDAKELARLGKKGSRSLSGVHKNNRSEAFSQPDVPSYQVCCSNGERFSAPIVINCAGIEADKVSELVAPVSFKLELSSGSYVMLDSSPRTTQETQATAPHSQSRASCGYPTHIVFSEPEEKGKGATFVPTVDGTLMVGPSHEDLSPTEFGQTAREPGYRTRAAGLDFVRTRSLEVFPGLPLEQIIRSFGTLRPAINWAHAGSDGSTVLQEESIHDFAIGWAPECPGFLNIAGVKTPGLTCADGIGSYVAGLVETYVGECEIRVERVGCKERKGSERREESEERKGDKRCEGHRGSVGSVAAVPHLFPTQATVAASLSRTPSDSEILCRCRQISYGEVRAAIRSELGARTVDGVKRRAGTGLGRCQGGFCTERVMLVLAEELSCSPTDIIKDRDGSWIARAEVLRDAQDNRAEVLRDAQDNRVEVLPQPNVRLLIIGGGAAGLAAACAAQETGLQPQDLLLVDRQEALGGILPQCSHYGFGKMQTGGAQQGPEFLAPLLKDFAARSIPSLLNTTVTSLSPARTVSLAGPTGLTFLEPEALILATGCRERPLGALPVAGARPSGIFTAGAAQRMVNLQNWDIGERIVILGSGDVGMVMAATLTARGKQVVSLVEQAAEATGLATNRQQYVDANNIPLLTQSTITQVFGQRRIEGVEIEELATKERRHLACDTLIVSVGLIPERDLLQDFEEPPLSAPWLFLAGNARRVHRFIEGVLADGKAAGKQAALRLNG